MDRKSMYKLVAPAAQKPTISSQWVLQSQLAIRLRIPEKKLKEQTCPLKRRQGHPMGAIGEKRVKSMDVKNFEISVLPCLLHSLLHFLLNFGRGKMSQEYQKLYYFTPCCWVKHLPLILGSVPMTRGNFGMRLVLLGHFLPLKIVSSKKGKFLTQQQEVKW